MVCLPVLNVSNQFGEPARDGDFAFLLQQKPNAHRVENRYWPSLENKTFRSYGACYTVCLGLLTFYPAGVKVVKRENSSQKPECHCFDF